MLLYMASRAQLVDEVIRPALKSGNVVVGDRFLLANVVYQGHGGGLDPNDIWQVGRVATAGLMPDLTVLLDVPTEVAKARVGEARDRMEDHPDDYRARVRAGFLHEARSCPWPVVVVDGSVSPDEVAERIRIEVERVLGPCARS
jgi:dTMP kinase